MWLFDRYILKLYFGYLVAAIVVFVTLYLAVDVLSFALRYSDASTSALIKYYAFHTPGIIYQLFPLACLAATLFTLSSLNKSNELVALYSSGVGLFRVALPIVIATSILSVGVFLVGDQLLPRFAQKEKYVEYVEIKKRPGLYSTVKTNRIWYRSGNILFNIKTLIPEEAKAQGITLYYFDDQWKLAQVITANEVLIKGSQWILKNGFVTLFAVESSFPLTKSFKTKTISMEEDMGEIQSTSNSSDVMSLHELAQFIKRNKEAGLDTLRYEVDYQSKFGFAFASIVMVLMAIPFSVSRSRSGGAFKNLGICIGLAFTYWALFSSAITLGQYGMLTPLVAAWGPNVLMAGFSTFLIRRLRQ